MGKPYRRCVVAVVTDEKGRFLVGERTRQPGAWQFPQGGVEDQETHREGLLRELAEEVGCGEVEILREGQSDVTYDFPPDLDVPIAAHFRGQTQKWFLVRFRPGFGPQLEKSDGEFQAVQWLKLEDVLPLIVPFKRDAYRDGLKSIGLKEG